MRFGGITVCTESLPFEQLGRVSREESAGLALSEHVAGVAKVAVSVIDPPVSGTVGDEGTKFEMVGVGT